jgi:hypothetical protein
MLFFHWANRNCNLQFFLERAHVVPFGKIKLY